VSTKYFHWDGGVKASVLGKFYKEGAPVEVVMFDQPLVAVQGWNGISEVDRATIITALAKDGWIEGEQSKPD